MFGATVPEATIDEHSNTRIWKDKIRPSEHLLIPAPAGDAVRPEQLCQGKFRLLVAAPANPRHHFRPFTFGKNVRHLGKLLKIKVAELSVFSEHPIYQAFIRLSHNRNFTNFSHGIW